MASKRSGKSLSSTYLLDSAKKTGRQFLNWLPRFAKRNWLGTAIILGATLLFFAPMLDKLGTYSPGGDAMFNAWTIARNQACMVGDNCPDYVDANIYHPHEDTMLYSESQLTPAVLTLPLSWFSDNTILNYNVYTIGAFFLSGWFMYLLVMRLSKGNRFVSVLAGLIFAFAPFKIAAIFHMQNLSIFFLPLAVLITLKYFDRKNKWWLFALLLTLVLQFYASWVQMVFVLATFGLLLLGFWIFKLEKFKPILMVGLTVVLAVVAVLPLAKEYMRFGRETQAGFSIKEQLLYESSLTDYFIPYENTLVGKIYYAMNPGTHMNAWNLDSYSYHGVILYVLAVGILVLAIMYRKKSKEDRKMFGWVTTLGAIGVSGFVLSLGPLLKVAGNFYYAQLDDGIRLAVPLPYLLIDKFLPQLAFIRAVGRWSVLLLFALCVVLAFLPYYLNKFDWAAKRKKWIYAAIGVIAFVELAPLAMVPMSKFEYSYNLQTPAVYKFVKEHKEINNLVVIAGDHDYPGAPIPIARAEWVLWAGYHNRNIFNGYSGYNPPEWLDQYIDFKDLSEDDIPKMKELKLDYVIIDKQLSSQKPELIVNANRIFAEKLYEDDRYALFKIP